MKCARCNFQYELNYENKPHLPHMQDCRGLEDAENYPRKKYISKNNKYISKKNNVLLVIPNQTETGKLCIKSYSWVNYNKLLI